MTDKRKPQPGDVCLARMVVKNTASDGVVYVGIEGTDVRMPVPGDLVEKSWKPRRVGEKVFYRWGDEAGTILALDGEVAFLGFPNGGHSVCSVRDMLDQKPEPEESDL